MAGVEERQKLQARIARMNEKYKQSFGLGMYGGRYFLLWEHGELSGRFSLHDIQVFLDGFEAALAFPDV